MGDSLPSPRAPAAQPPRYDAAPGRLAAHARPPLRRPSACRRPLDAARPGMSPELSVVIPMYDEEDVLPLLVERLRPLLDGLGTSYEVLAVDDGSRDAHPGAAAALPPRLAPAAAAAAAGQRRAPGGDLGRPRARPGRLRGHPRRRPAGPAGGDRRDAGGGPARRGRRRLRRPRRPVHRLGVQARLGPGVLPADPPGQRHRRAGRRRRLPADVPGHGRRGQRPARAPPGAALRRAGPGLPQQRGALPPRDARGRQLEVPAAPGCSGSSVDSLTGFSTAPLRLATWFGIGGGVAALGLLVYALVAQLSGHTVAGWTSTVVAVAAVGAVQLLCLGLLGEYIGRMYTQMQGRPSYFVAYDSLEVSPDDVRSREARHRASGAPAGSARR